MPPFPQAEGKLLSSRICKDRTCLVTLLYLPHSADDSRVFAVEISERMSWCERGC